MAATKTGTTSPKTDGRVRRDEPALPVAERLVYSVPEAGRLLGLSRNSSYEAARRGDIPTIRIGRLLLVPKLPFQRLLSLMPAGATGEDEGGAA